jgi:hypothetical protein
VPCQLVQSETSSYFNRLPWLIQLGISPASIFVTPIGGLPEVAGFFSRACEITMTREMRVNAESAESQ